MCSLFSSLYAFRDNQPFYEKRVLFCNLTSKGGTGSNRILSKPWQGSCKHSSTLELCSASKRRFNNLSNEPQLSPLALLKRKFCNAQEIQDGDHCFSRQHTKGFYDPHSPFNGTKECPMFSKNDRETDKRKVRSAEGRKRKGNKNFK